MKRRSLCDRRPIVWLCDPRSTGSCSSLVLICLLALASWLGAGCSSTNVNPAAARTHTGYVDLYPDSDRELYWEVQELDRSSNNYKEAFSEMNPAKDGFLRLAFQPGHYQLRITFLNLAVVEPALVEVDVEDGRVTPVLVGLVQAGVSTVRSKQTSMGGTMRGGYGRRTKLIDSQTGIYRVTAAPQPQQAYRVKQEMPYRPKSTG